MIYRCDILAVRPAVAWGAMPAAETEVFGDVGGHRVRAYTRWVTQFRILRNVRIAGFAGSKLRVKYFDGAGFTDLAETAGAGDTLIDGIGEGSGPWSLINPAARQDTVTLAIFGVGGNGVVAPQFTWLGVEFHQ